MDIDMKWWIKCSQKMQFNYQIFPKSGFWINHLQPKTRAWSALWGDQEWWQEIREKRWPRECDICHQAIHLPFILICCTEWSQQTHCLHGSNLHRNERVQEIGKGELIRVLPGKFKSQDTDPSSGDLVEDWKWSRIRFSCVAWTKDIQMEGMTCFLHQR